MSLRCDQIPVAGSATIAASGQTAAFDWGSYRSGLIAIAITASVGSFTTLDFFLQGSLDGTTFTGAVTGTAIGVPYFGGLHNTATPSNGVYCFGVGNALSLSGATNPVPFLLPRMRLAYTLAGGTSVTFSATALMYHD